jgi:hypothetical protein
LCTVLEFTCPFTNSLSPVIPGFFIPAAAPM